jgi:acetyl/propionyl-CoA carboxylase alpha subunit
MPTDATIRPFSKLLIANRGEIACRIIRSARALGIRTLAVHTEADAGALHVLSADEATALPEFDGGSAYLNMDGILGVARRAGADAIHPGYGFLAENADFARAVEETGLVFVGPSPETIDAAADKVRARELMENAGVPVLPGMPEPADPSTLALRAQEIGYPLLVKARAGGGGRGMRVVRGPDDLERAIESAKREAATAFGDDSLLLERFVEQARHVEVQIFGDTHGSVVSLGERDCSAQRRHQKILEESPAPTLGDELRRNLSDAAVNAARAISYRGAGTVEFLVDEEHRFYFLEINARLQVEHPVTELVSGLDLVDLQLRVAAGEQLPAEARNFESRGHAIEARICAESPELGFMPETGMVALWIPPEGRFVRCDHGLAGGERVGSEFDPMLAKVIVWGEDRRAALARLSMALESTTLLGLRTNLSFLQRLVDSPQYRGSQISTHFLESEAARPLREGEPLVDDLDWAAAAILEAEDELGARGRSWSDSWRGWRNAHESWWPVSLEAAATRRSCKLRASGEVWTIRFADNEAKRLVVRVRDRARGALSIEADGVHRRIRHARDEDGRRWIHTAGATLAFSRVSARSRAGDMAEEAQLSAPTSGTVIRVQVAAGEHVKVGDPLLSLEAMKIESILLATREGQVSAVHVQGGQAVARGQILVEFEPLLEPPPSQASDSGTKELDSP